MLIFFFWKKWEKLLHSKSFSHFFNKKYWHIWDFNVWNFKVLLTNEVISFEQPVPGKFAPSHSSGQWLQCSWTLLQCSWTIAVAPASSDCMAKLFICMQNSTHWARKLSVMLFCTAFLNKHNWTINNFQIVIVLCLSHFTVQMKMNPFLK